MRVVCQNLTSRTSVTTHGPSAAGHGDEPLRFSLAGVQLKFSAVMEASGGLAIPAGGMKDSFVI